MRMRETERLRFIKDTAHFHSWRVIDIKAGCQVGTVMDHPSEGLWLQVAGSARLSVEQVRDIAEMMEAIHPKG